MSFEDVQTRALALLKHHESLDNEFIDDLHSIAASDEDQGKFSKFNKRYKRDFASYNHVTLESALLTVRKISQLCECVTIDGSTPFYTDIPTHIVGSSEVYKLKGWLKSVCKLLESKEHEVYQVGWLRENANRALQNAEEHERELRADLAFLIESANLFLEIYPPRNVVYLYGDDELEK